MSLAYNRQLTYMIKKSFALYSSKKKPLYCEEAYLPESQVYHVKA